MDTRILICAALAVLVSAPQGLAQESEPEDTVYPDDPSVPSVKCIRPKMIKKAEAVNEKNILFHMRGGKIYRNVLPQRCTPLVQGFAFSYNSTYGRICDVDNITIVGGSAGGTICPLGKFYPLTDQELDLLIHEVNMTEELGLENEPEI